MKFNLLSSVTLVCLILAQCVLGQSPAIARFSETDGKQLGNCFGTYVTEKHILMTAACATLAIPKSSLTVDTLSEENVAKQTRKRSRD